MQQASQNKWVKENETDSYAEVI